jgi:hypothetical protein
LKVYLVFFISIVRHTSLKGNELQRTLLQNRVATRKNHRIVEMARCMLKCRGSPNIFGYQAVHTTIYVLNRSQIEAFEGKT